MGGMDFMASFFHRPIKRICFYSVSISSQNGHALLLGCGGTSNSDIHNQPWEKTMNKTFFALLCIGVVCATAIYADDSLKNSGGDERTFEGQITAIEERDSITVISDSNIVKMFAVGEDRKADLLVGDRVSVRYFESWQWPLRTSSIKVTGGLEK